MSEATRSTASSWRRLVPPAAIFFGLILVILFLAEDLRNGLFSPFGPALNWTNARNNAGAVQAFSAIVLAILTAALLWATWQAVATAREDANQSREQTRKFAIAAQVQASKEAERVAAREREASRAAERQATLSTLPVLAFRHPNVTGDTAFGQIQLVLANVGLGPAVATEIEVAYRVIRYTSDRNGEEFTIRSGEEVSIMINATSNDELDGVPGQAHYDAHGWIPLARLKASCFDIRGNGWKHEVDLVWDHGTGVLRLANPEHTFP